MSVEILIRKMSVQSPYREAIKKLIEMEGNKLIIATGYINNSSEWNNGEALKYIGDLIKKKIEKEKFNLIILGGKVDKNYPDNAIEFCKRLDEYVGSKHLNISLRRIYGDCWHGKVALKADSDSKIYGVLLGSSNFTPASILTGKLYFSMELDMLIVNGNIVNNYKTISCDLDTDQMRKEYENWNKLLENKIKKFNENTEYKLSVDMEIEVLRKNIKEAEKAKEKVDSNTNQNIKEKSKNEKIIWIKTTVLKFEEIIVYLDNINECVIRIQKSDEKLYEKIEIINNEKIKKIEQVKKIKKLLEEAKGTFDNEIKEIGELLQKFEKYKCNYVVELNETTQNEILKNIYMELHENTIELSEEIYFKKVLEK